MSDSADSNPQTQSRDFEILNRKGLHARAAAKFVRVVSAHESDVWVSREDNRVDGRAIMDLLMLAAAQGTTITVEAVGPDAKEVLDALEDIITNRFDEGE